MRFAVHQPNHAPWCGYFAKMAAVDVFVLLDDVQMPQGRSYVSRTRIRSGHDERWLTVPVRRAGRQPIHEVEIADPSWVAKHARTLTLEYGRAPAFDEAWSAIGPLFERSPDLLVDFNAALITAVRDLLGLQTQLLTSSDFAIEATGDRRIIEIGRRLGAETYVSGPGGQNYQIPEHFEAAGMALEVRTYEPVSYPQIHGAFVPGLSILDALFHLGGDASQLLHYADPSREEP